MESKLFLFNFNPLARATGIITRARIMVRTAHFDTCVHTPTLTVSEGPFPPVFSLSFQSFSLSTHTLTPVHSPPVHLPKRQAHNVDLGA